MNTEALGRKALTDILRSKAGIKQSYASQLVTGARSPALDLALRIEETAGVPVGIWRVVNERGAFMWAHLMSERTA
jgi:plasmid maintenance system antidote protein VapI